MTAMYPFQRATILLLLIVSIVYVLSQRVAEGRDLGRYNTRYHVLSSKTVPGANAPYPKFVDESPDSLNHNKTQIEEPQGKAEEHADSLNHNNTQAEEPQVKARINEETVEAPRNATEEYEIIGLQYSDTAYVTSLLFVSVPAGVVYLFFCFFGNSKTFAWIFAAVSAAILSFYISLALLINLETSALWGLSVSSPILATVFGASMFYPEELGWNINIFSADIFLIALLCNVIGAATPSGYGIFSAVYSFERLSPETQYMIFYGSLLFFSAVAFALHVFTGKVWRCPPRVSRNLVSSFVSAFGVIATISYVSVISGISMSSAIDPISFFQFPTAFNYGNIFGVCLLVGWLTLTTAGYAVQQRRDKIPFGAFAE